MGLIFYSNWGRPSVSEFPIYLYIRGMPFEISNSILVKLGGAHPSTALCRASEFSLCLISWVALRQLVEPSSVLLHWASVWQCTHTWTNQVGAWSMLPPNYPVLLGRTTHPIYDDRALTGCVWEPLWAGGRKKGLLSYKVWRTRKKFFKSIYKQTILRSCKWCEIPW